ncbi:YczE/YyaS/YitT family protein [Streptococcus gallolyticus]
MKNKCYRYFLFFLGLLCNGFGVTFIRKAALGTTPIASIPHTLSLIFPKITLGKFTIMVVSMILILAQVLILRKQSHFVDTVLQIPISFLFGYVIDFSTWLLTFFNPENYGVKLISLLIGCLIIAFGIYFEVVVNVAILPADGFS